MTLPLRKKHLTTAKSIRRKTTVTKAGARSWLCSAFKTAVPCVFKTAMLGGCSLYAAALLSSVGVAQQPGWQPTRMPSQSDARPLASASATSSQSASNQANPNSGQGSGVALRWMSVTTSSAPTSSAQASSAQASSAQASQGGPASAANNSANVQTAFSTQSGPRQSSPQSNPQNSMRAVQTAATQSNSNRTVSTASGWNSNPLRGEQVAGKPAVRTANYQQQSSNDPFGDRQSAPPGAGNGLPEFPQGNLPGAQQGNQPELPLPQFPQDSLSNPELAPVPGGEEVQPEPISPTPTLPQNDPSPLDRAPNQKADPFGDRGKESEAEKAMNESAGDEGDKRDDLKMPKRKKDASSNSCNDMRERVRQMRLSDISLDVSPEYGKGLRAREAGEKERLNFAASAPIRDWMDYTGTIVATGRLIDLRDDCVVLDQNGREQKIPLRDLSDIDVAYVADAWNLPMKCGIGYEAYAGRQFIPSAVEWKASGLCHKPLYFEDVQLERYGHEVGPVLQPLISSAHFFGNMLILPYKMGVNPPSECQYALGYYRPGNCAPYMIQPFPFSLRGAAAQAGFVSGAAALIP